MKNLSANTKDQGLSEKEALVKKIEELEAKNENLREFAGNYSVLFENHSSIMLLIDPYDLSIIDANKAAIDFYKYSKKELCSKRLQDLCMVSEKEILEEFETAKGEHRDYFNFIQKLATNEIKYVEIRSTPIFSNKTETLFAIITDVTKRKLAEQQLLEAKRKVEESDSLKSEFLANMSHEIRTPLNGILGFADMLKHEDLSLEERDQFLSIINNCGNHLLGLVNNLIDLSQLESNTLVLRPKPSSISQVFLKLKNQFDEMIQTRRKDIDILQSPVMEDKLERVFIDAERLEQVLYHFLDNAIKFTDSGFVKFGCRLINNRIDFYIEDTGIGLSEEDQREIFKRFIQLDKASTKKYQGSGLGLALAKGLIEKMGGNLKVYSEKNIGSTFSFSIPFVKSPEEVKETIKKEIDLKGKTILVADDTLDDYYFMEYGLRSTRAKVLHAKNGFDAIEKFKNNQIDLLIMDMQMPLLNGEEATKEIRYFDKQVPIIAISGNNLNQDKELSIQAGCNEYLTKPVDLNELINKLVAFFE